ncbi:MAG: hypothetical protein LBL76_00590 [Treponema sp.]|jgi:hypothetical protein|nr:hypothetical protein [Treponema sp.]
MPRGIIRKAAAGLLLLLLLEGCTSVYTWWDVPPSSQHQKPSSPTIAPGTHPPFIDPDPRPADNPAPAAPVYPAQIASAPASTGVDALPIQFYTAKPGTSYRHIACQFYRNSDHRETGCII